jgi:SIR2-like domain
LEKDEQIIKCRDDKAPIVLSKVINESEAEPAFKVSEGSNCSWLSKDDTITPEKLRPRIEPWLTALFQSEHFSLLIGSGLTHAIHRMAAGKSLPGMSQANLSHYSDEINAGAKKSAEVAGRKEGNIEDQVRVAFELLRGLEIIASSNAELKKKADGLRMDLTTALSNFATSILAGEHGLITAKADTLENALNYLVSFLMSFASRTGTRDRLQVFTTNYDRCIEMGAELAGLHLLDRFVGSLAPIFRSSRLDVDMHYNPPGIRGEPRYLEGVARFTKLHGSLDWVNTGRSIRRTSVPFGATSVEPYLKAPGLADSSALQLMIYPNSAKDRETAAYPYVELFRDFAAASCRPNNTLITFGYSFGDEHINRVIEDMLTIPSTHLVIMSHSDPLGRIMQTYTRLGRHAQITLLIGNHVGDFQALVDYYLPKPAIDRTTFRMSELLKARWGTQSQQQPVSTQSNPREEGSES